MLLSRWWEVMRGWHDAKKKKKSGSSDVGLDSKRRSLIFLFFPLKVTLDFVYRAGSLRRNSCQVRGRLLWTASGVWVIQKKGRNWHYKHEDFLEIIRETTAIQECFLFISRLWVQGGGDGRDHTAQVCFVLRSLSIKRHHTQIHKQQRVAGV